jgi:glycosyltransferase involved in cell wall biosynthesis
MDFIPVIPSLNPDAKLINLVNELIENNFKKIIIVDDGSIDKIIFNKLKEKKEVIVLTHDVNKGKGAALKTAFSYYKDKLIDKYKGVVCLDSDGQHRVSDAINVANTMIKENKFTLGTRLFNTKETPLRNKTGNRITSRVFKWFYGVYIKDTQTGLRAIPNRLIDLHLNTYGDRFEYEMNALIDLVKNGEKIQEVDIKTVYLANSNKKSNFKVFKDSYKIYKLMFKRIKK